MMRSAFLPAASLILLLFMVVPLPPMMLDIGFVANIMLSLAVLMVALNVQRALDFSSFPTVLLFATLFRLALNVASTRVVLMHGHEGSDAAGHVIEAFGAILVGGDYVVGLFVFAILLIINLVVITKGAGRVSEVSARFTLDALPGKQMAIDADLNAGLITADEARTRRADVSTEADFYGSMDGASKFVKGDAIAGLLILVINIIGGIILGVISHGLGLSKAAETYVLLAIGDALVAQVPALLLSIAAASIVTRVTSKDDLAGQLGLQFGDARHWFPVAAILLMLGLIPGMPHLILIAASMAALGIGYAARRSEQARLAAQHIPGPDSLTENPTLIRQEDVSESAAITLDLGFGLVPMIDERKGAPLMQRITAIRRQLSQDLGFVIPLVRVRDDLQLPANGYRIRINGAVIGEDLVQTEDLLALATGDVDAGSADALSGKVVKDPSFGLDAIWIAPHQRSAAIVAGYTVVDAPTVIVTHLNQLLKRDAEHLFGIDDAKALIDTLKLSAPHLAETLSALPQVHVMIGGVVRGLLREGVPVRDFRPIAETMVQHSSSDTATMRADNLLEQVRRAIGSSIVQTIVPIGLPLPVITLAPELESLVAEAVRISANTSGGGDAMIEPSLADRIINALRTGMLQAAASHGQAALITAPLSRPMLARLVRPHLPDLAVLSYLELPEAKRVDVVAVVGADTNAPPTLLHDSGAISAEKVIP
jgi:flagellar biosynthesis protein FlhA